MKFRLPIGVCVVISLVLVLFGVVFGTVSGYTDDRKQVTALLEEEDGLRDVLCYRGADGLNLCVVAGRHLDAGEESLLRLKDAAENLRSSGRSLTEKRSDAADMEAAWQEVSALLKQTASFEESDRDTAYLAMLTADQQSLSGSAAVSAYNSAASAFNRKLTGTFIGKLAGLFGIKPCELF